MSLDPMLYYACQMANSNGGHSWSRCLQLFDAASTLPIPEQEKVVDRLLHLYEKAGE